MCYSLRKNTLLTLLEKCKNKEAKEYTTVYGQVNQFMVIHLELFRSVLTGK